MAASTRTGSDEGFPVQMTMAGVIAAGKTCIVHRLATGKFPEGVTSTIGTDYLRTTEYVDGHRVLCAVWDTAGQERFKTFVGSAMRTAHVVLFVYDASCEDDAKVLVDSFVVPNSTVLPMTASVVIVANKSDLLKTDEARVAAQTRLDTLVERIQDVFSSNSGAIEGFMASAKTNDGIPALKERLLRHGFDSAVEAAKSNGYAHPGLTSSSVGAAAGSKGSGGDAAAARITLDGEPAAKPRGIFALPCFK